MGRGLVLDGPFRSGQNRRSAARQHIGVDTPGRIDRFSNSVVVVAGYDDRIAVRVNTADDTDVTAAATPHDGDGADLRTTYLGAVAGIRARKISAARMTGPLKHQIHEGSAPKTAPARRIGADVFTRFDYQRIAGCSAERRI